MLEVAWAAVEQVEPRVCQFLSEGEVARAARHHHPKSRAASVAGAALMRALVARHLACLPSQVRLVRWCPVCKKHSDHGQPQVEADTRLFLSLSHTDSTAVVAVSDLGPVGVDVERPEATRFVGFEIVALHPVEMDAIAQLDRRLREEARASLWVRKEAVLKCGGLGLLGRPSDVLTNWPAISPRLVGWPTELDRFIAEFGVLSVTDLDAPAGHVAALAVADDDARREPLSVDGNAILRRASMQVSACE